MTDYNPLYRKAYSLDYQAGIRRTTPAAPITDHVRWLQHHGATIQAIAAAASISPKTVGNVANATFPRVNIHTAKQLLAITLNLTQQTPTVGHIPAVGARRRIQALLAIGWTHTDITAAIHASGHGPTRSHRILYQPGPTITAANHEAAAAVFTKLCMTPGPSDRTRARAARRGYLPPLAWDDIDDPNEHPGTVEDIGVDYLDWAAVERRAAGDRTVRLTKAEAREVITQLRRQGLPDNEIARRSGLKVERYAPLQRDLQEGAATA